MIENIKGIFLKVLQRLFVLTEDHVGLNISKVLAVANIAGFMKVADAMLAQGLF